MKDNYFIETRFSADKDHFTKTGLTDQLPFPRWTIWYFTYTLLLRGLLQLSKKTLIYSRWGKQGFLATARQAHLNFALASFNFQRSKQNLKVLGPPNIIKFN